MLLMATIIHQRANEPSTFTASSQSHKSALIAVPQRRKLPATSISALMPGTISLMPPSAICTVISYCCVAVGTGWMLHHVSTSGSIRAGQWSTNSLLRCILTRCIRNIWCWKTSLRETKRFLRPSVTCEWIVA